MEAEAEDGQGRAEQEGEGEGDGDGDSTPKKESDSEVDDSLDDLERQLREKALRSMRKAQLSPPPS